MTINEIQDEIIEEFSGFDDWMDKYQLLIDPLRHYRGLPPRTLHCGQGRENRNRERLHSQVGYSE